MAKTVVGLMENAAEARQVVQELIEAGIERGKIGMMASDAESGSPVDATPDDSVVGEGVLKGAGTGAVFGGLTGLLAGLAGLAIPGVGPVIAAGPIAAAFAGGGIGAVAGGAISALTNIGVPEEKTQYYTEGLRRGGVLVTVYAEDADMAERSAGIMRRHYAAEVDETAMALDDREETGEFADFMAANETSFDPNGTPGKSDLGRDAQLTSPDERGDNRQDHAVAKASLDQMDEPGIASERPASALSGNAEGNSMREPASANAAVDDAASRKPPKAHHAKANAVLAAARFLGSERRRAGAPRYTGVERRALIT